MAETKPFYINTRSQQFFVDYHKRHFDRLGMDWDYREQMRRIDLNYLREADLTVEQARATNANLWGNSNKIQNVTVPVVSPQVASAVAYQTAVFLQDYPLFGVISGPEYIDAAKAFQAIIEDNALQGQWVTELMQFFYDGMKYNRSAVEVCWDRKVTAAVETDPGYKGGKEGRPVDLIWQGNTIVRWDMYNTYWDNSCRLEKLPDQGEYVGRTEIISRIALMKWFAQNPGHIKSNVRKALSSPSMLNVFSGAGNGPGFYIPQLNQELNVDPLLNGGDIDWAQWMGLSKQIAGEQVNWRGLYEMSTEYVRIIPSEFELPVPAPNDVQVWKLIFINHSVLVKAERMTNAHDKIPVFFGQPAMDGLGYQSKSLATNSIPFQQVASAIMNSIIAARRRAVTDRALYDPSRVSEAHMNNPNPAAKIPVRPQAFGKPVGEAVYQFPFRDDQSQIGFQEIQSILGMANTLNGQNAARQGQFVKGNKTDGQWDQTMSNATSQDQLSALKMEAHVFTPTKEVIKLNTMQYQGGTTLYSPGLRENVQVDPLVLRKAILAFKLTDGLTPKEKVMATDTRKVAMQVIGSSETLSQGYNVAPMFSYIMKSENVDLTAFEKTPAQVAYEQAAGNWTQLAQLAIQKQAPFSTPQPKPADFGYDPNMQNPASMAAAQAAGGNNAQSNQQPPQVPQGVNNGNAQ